MHFTEYYAILERDLDVLNPTSPEALDRLEIACGVRDGSRVLDVGSGKGALLRRWARAHAIRGVGLELNPHSIRAAPWPSATGTSPSPWARTSTSPTTSPRYRRWRKCTSASSVMG